MTSLVITSSEWLYGESIVVNLCMPVTSKNLANTSFNAKWLVFPLDINTKSKYVDKDHYQKEVSES